MLSAPAYSASLTVKTDKGKVAGKTINDGKVNAFMGIPYAAPPVGDLRWKATQPAAKWKGVRDATKYGNHCVGRESPDMIFLDPGPSEDCLYINVYTPATSTAKSKLPVMFWIHGGGYSGGASSEPRHNGDFMPLKGVVLVTFNYRLSLFGFLVTAEQAKEANGVAGNYGFLDMIAALQWVKSNITNFGGDPGNVTIFGESAGSMAVSTLVASPAARGLFQKAIGESGGALGQGPRSLGYESLEANEKASAEWMDSIGVKSLAELRAMPTDKVWEAASGKNGIRAVPDIDGKVLVEPVKDTYAAGRQAHIPLLAGSNRDESPNLGNGMTVEKWKAYAAEHFGDNAAEFLKLYPGDTDEQASRSAADYGGDSFIAYCTWNWLDAHSKTSGSPVYRYHMEIITPPSKFHPVAQTFHSDDIEYIFGTLDTRPGQTVRPEDRTLSEQMMSYWTNFAKTGDPNGPGLPTWPKYDKDDSLIHLDSTITSGPDPIHARYDFLLRVYPTIKF